MEAGGGPWRPPVSVRRSWSSAASMAKRACRRKGGSERDLQNHRPVTQSRTCARSLQKFPRDRNVAIFQRSRCASPGRPCSILEPWERPDQERRSTPGDCDRGGRRDAAGRSGERSRRSAPRTGRPLGGKLRGRSAGIRPGKSHDGLCIGAGVRRDNPVPRGVVPGAIVPVGAHRNHRGGGP